MRTLTRIVLAAAGMVGAGCAVIALAGCSVLNPTRVTAEGGSAEAGEHHVVRNGVDTVTDTLTIKAPPLPTAAGAAGQKVQR